MHVAWVRCVAPERLRAHVGPVGLDEHHCVSARALCTLSVGQPRPSQFWWKPLTRASGTKVVEDFPPQRPPRYTPTFLLGTVANFLTSSDRRPLSKLALHVLGPSH